MGLTLRPATLQDASRLYKWRVDDEQAAWWQGDHPTFGQHVEWLIPRLANPAMRLLIAEFDGVPVGQTRIDSDGEVSFSIAREHRGHSLGAIMLREAAATSGWHRLKACADSTNLSGRNTLIAAGFEFRDDVRFYRWPS